MKSMLVFLVAAVIAFCGGLSAPACVCDKRECETINEVDCPGLGIVVWDPCRCCQECARTEGEPCGGDLGFSGTCEPGLSCQQPGPSPSEGTCRPIFYHIEGNATWKFKIGENDNFSGDPLMLKQTWTPLDLEFFGRENIFLWPVFFMYSVKKSVNWILHIKLSFDCQ